MYNFQKVRVWVQVLTRVALNARNQNLDIGRHFYEIYIFVIFNAVTSSVTWRERPKLNIRSKSLLEPFSKNIFKQSCSLINRVLKNGYDYFFLKKCGSRKSNRKNCQLPGQQLFEVGVKENFAKGLRVYICSLWWRCQSLLISIAFGEDRFLRIFSEEEAWRKERKGGFTFARFLFTATQLEKKNSKDWTCIFFKRNFWKHF